MNTWIGFLYRDAGNYKVWNEAIVPSEMTEEQIARIGRALDDGYLFIPELVGLPVERFGQYIPELDFPLCELDVKDIQPTEREATVDISVEELVRTFEKHRGRWFLAREKSFLGDDDNKLLD